MTASPDQHDSAPRSSWRGDLAGGLTGALVAFSIAVPLGTLAFAPLGPAHAGTGVAAGLVGAAVGGLVAAIAGSSAHLRSGPMTAVVLVVNALIAALLALPGMREPPSGAMPRVLAFALLCVILAGLLQILFGRLRLGNAIKFVPRPVLAGFRNGIAILIAVTQMPALLGLPDPTARFDLATLGASARPWSLAVGTITVASVLLARRYGFAAVALFAGLILGTGSHHALHGLVGPDALGGTIGALPGPAELPLAWRMPDALAGEAGTKALVLTLAPAVGVAVVGAVLSLLAVRLADDLTGERSDNNRELVGQGWGNVLSGLFGGTPIAGSPSTTVASYQGGGRTRRSAVFTTAFLVLCVALAARGIATIPLAALAGVMVVIALDMLDRSTLELVADIRANAGRATESIADLAIVAAVAIASVVVNVLAGVATGVAISVAIFAIKSSRKIVRRHATRATRQSLRQRGHHEMQLLHDLGSQIALFELEGNVFFGTADRLAHEVEARAGDARFVILDCGRVNAVDATGAHVVGQVARQLASRGGQLVLTGLPAEDGRRRSLERGCPPSLARWVPDADRALEWCEEAVLAAAGPDAAAREELPLDRVDLCREMAPEEVAQLRAAMVRESHPRGTVLFREGEPGDCMYLLVHGAVSMVLRAPDDPERTKRLVTFAPGVVFGEMALLQGNPRSADGVCDSDCTVYTISRDALRRLGEHNHAMAIKVYRALALTLADRLRRTTLELRHVSAQ